MAQGTPPVALRRKVSFSSDVPPFAMTTASAGPSTPPARRERARVRRSPFPAAAVGKVEAPLDYFSQGASGVIRDPQVPLPALTPPIPGFGHEKHDSIGDPFMGDIPRVTSDTELAGISASSSSSSLSRSSPRKPLPRLDFSNASTPLVTRGTFTPRPVRTRDSYSPTHALGRKISLNNLGGTFVDAETGSSDEDDEFDDALEQLDGEVKPELPETPTYGLSEVHVVNLSGPRQEHTPPFTVELDDGGIVDLNQTLDEDDRDEVDIELDLGGLSLGQSSTSVSEAEGDQDLVSSAASTPGWDRELSPASTLSPDRVLEEYDERHSPAPITPVKHCPEADVPASPSASFQIVSPLPSPARLWPSVPSTPTRETAGYMSDESDSWVPRRRAAARRVVVSDDDEEPAPRKSQARGLRGRIPAAIAKLNAADSEDELEGGPDPTTEASYDVDNEESMGSLRDFIVDSDCEEEIADGEDIIEIISSDEEEESQDIDCGDDLPVDSQGIPIIDLVSDSDECDEEDSPLPIDGDTLHFLPPPPPVALPDMGRLSLEPPSKPARAPLTPSRTVRKAPMTAREWATRREQYAQKLFNELDSRVFGSKLSSCGATIEWGARLRTTAGQAHHSKRGGSNVYKIVLSNKVLSTEHQIRDTLAHEMCHLACWVISNEHKNPHGRVFKSWGSKVHAARPDIIVTTKHSYVINFKYEWRCSSATCAKVYRRHSKSIDTSRQVCGACRSRLEPLFASKASTPFQDYLRDNMKGAKAALRGAKHGDVMRALSKRWAEAQSATAAEHDAYWRSLA